jgi:signal transduction histidine kinase
MRLSDFIRANREPILVEWEAFARTCTPASAPMDVRALRDHAEAMLLVIADDLATFQGSRAQAEKSKGRAPDEAGDARTAAEEHGTGRAESGFTVAQMVAEYRALRASVVRLWTKAEGALDAPDVEDLTRFHEAIDQALAESVLRFNADLEESKETFLAILGHDLRLPLGAIQTSAAFLLDVGELQEEAQRTLLTRIAGSATRSITMVGDLLDFTRSRLGNGIPVERTAVDLDRLVREVVAEIAAVHPAHPIRVESAGAAEGHWDPSRLSQALGNLIANAVQHGAAGSAVTVTLGDAGDEAVVGVHNRGAVIPPEQLDGIFNPMKPRRTLRLASARGPTASLGLGLYIAERIVGAHEGRIDVESSEATGTTFTVRLPRHATAQPA